MPYFENDIKNLEVTIQFIVHLIRMSSSLKHSWHLSTGQQNSSKTIQPMRKWSSWATVLKKFSREKPFWLFLLFVRITSKLSTMGNWLLGYMRPSSRSLHSSGFTSRSIRSWWPVPEASLAWCYRLLWCHLYLHPSLTHIPQTLSGLKGRTAGKSHIPDTLNLTLILYICCLLILNRVLSKF